MALECPHINEGGVQIGKYIGIGLASGVLCGCFLVLTFFIVYRFIWQQYLLPINQQLENGMRSTKSKNSPKIAPRIPKLPPDETQQCQTRNENKRSNKYSLRHLRFNKNTHAAQIIPNLPQTENYEPDRSSYVKFETHTPHWEMNDEEPTYQNVAEANDNEYATLEPYNVQKWKPVYSEQDNDYLHMASTWSHQWKESQVPTPEMRGPLVQLHQHSLDKGTGNGATDRRHPNAFIP